MRIFVSLRARSDLLDIYGYLAERSPAAAERIMARLSQRFDELREFPLSGRDRSEFGPSLRSLLIDGYGAFYLVEADRVVIVRALDGRGDIEREMSNPSSS
ncbi:MAG TPA: type II toxin-antitoxin system RelE/ParE family toxin [Bradyrhizobium sp.]|nr:type II toxin-antitoxin system RelE/ParE family toxin [Bradyrhizobium sp.]